MRSYTPRRLVSALSRPRGHTRANAPPLEFAAHAGSKYAEAADALTSLEANRDAIYGLNQLQAEAGPSAEEEASALKLPARHALNAVPTPHRG